jgi:REP element-mobilizing transposase RayT
LRASGVFARVRAALSAGKERFGFTLVHFSVQSDHLHLLAEAPDRSALSRGVAGLCIRIARAVNRVLSRSGRLFADRYHARALKTPREARLALRYVLLNARKHAAQSRRAGVAPGFVDGCSSAAWFDGFARPVELAFGGRFARAEWARASGGSEPPVVRPRTWLLRIGYRRAGPFDVDEVPSG